MADVLKLLLTFGVYFVMAFAFVLALFVLPGWWWSLIAAVFILAIVLGVAAGLGHQWAKLLAYWLFWVK